jgi:hypothetical protein
VKRPNVAMARMIELKKGRVDGHVAGVQKDIIINMTTCSLCEWTAAACVQNSFLCRVSISLTGHDCGIPTLSNREIISFIISSGIPLPPLRPLLKGWIPFFGMLGSVLSVSKFGAIVEAGGIRFLQTVVTGKLMRRTKFRKWFGQSYIPQSANPFTTLRYQPILANAACTIYAFGVEMLRAHSLKRLLRVVIL